MDIRDLPDHPQDGYAVLRAEAKRLAGAPGDIVQRVTVHYSIYRDSGGNHAFPLIASHGALWAAGFFETTGRLGDALRARYFYDSKERALRMAMLDGFANGFKAVNRSVLMDTFTNYYYTQRYGGHPGATGAMHPHLFEALNAVHQATASGVGISAPQRRYIFEQALRYEQEVTVAPGVREEIDRFDCPILRFLCLRPIVQFSYFPRSTYFLFRDFSDAGERIDKAMRAYDIAVRRGWQHTESALRSSTLLPTAFAEGLPVGNGRSRRRIAEAEAEGQAGAKAGSLTSR